MYLYGDDGLDQLFCDQQRALQEETEGLLGDLFAVECLAQCLRHGLLPQDRYSPAMIRAYARRLEDYLDQHIGDAGRMAKQMLRQCGADRLQEEANGG